jgi:hypothetical protein
MPNIFSVCSAFSKQSIVHAQQAIKTQKHVYLVKTSKNYFHNQVPQSSTDTGLDCLENLAVNISCFGPFNI